MEAPATETADGAVESGRPTRCALVPARARIGLVVLVVAFLLSRAAYAIAGVRFDASALNPTDPGQVQWQLLPLRLLRHDLLRSVWHLHGQPPLYNLLCGVLLRLPSSLQNPAAHGLFALLGVLLVTTTFLLLLELRINRWIALTIGLCVVASPSLFLYEQWLSWSYPTAVLLVVGVYCLVRFTRTTRPSWAGMSAACFGSVVLLNATFQWPWFALAISVILLAGRAQWRTVVRSTAIPFLVVFGWYVKDAVQFGTVSTSSWLGMNLDHTTLRHAPQTDLANLLRTGRIDSLASIQAFQPVQVYESQLGTPSLSGVPALDVRTTELGVPNFNNRIYVSVSERYLKDDLTYIRARPLRYLSNVTVSADLWAIPGDQYLWTARNYAHIGGYARLYDGVILLEPHYASYFAEVAAETEALHPPLRELSWTTLLVTVVDLLLAPVALLRRRRDLDWLAPTLLLFGTVTYSFLVTSALELGENMRFYSELGTLPIVLAVVAVSALLRDSTARTFSGEE